MYKDWWWPIGRVYYARGEIYDVETTSGIEGASVRLQYLKKSRYASTDWEGKFSRCVWYDGHDQWINALASKDGYEKRSKSFWCSIPCAEDPDGCPDVYDCPGDAGVGGIAELPDVASDSGSSTGAYAALAGGLAAAMVALAAGAWYARRRLS